MINSSPKIKFRYISLKKLRIWSEANVRKTDAYVGIEDLAKNIKEIGMIVPLAVVPYKKKYRIISGQRRFIAAGKADLKEAPCLIFKKISVTEAKILSFSENIFREDMTEDDKADATSQLKKQLGDVGEVAKHLGISKSSVYNFLSWRSVFPRLRKMVSKGKIPPLVAKQIYRKFSNDEEFAYELAKAYAARSNKEKSDFFAAIKDANPKDSLDVIKRKFKKFSTSESFTIRLPKSSSKLVKTFAKKMNITPSFVIVELVERSLDLLKRGRFRL